MPPNCIHGGEKLGLVKWEEYELDPPSEKNNEAMWEDKFDEYSDLAGVGYCTKCYDKVICPHNKKNMIWLINQSKGFCTVCRKIRRK